MRIMAGMLAVVAIGCSSAEAEAPRERELPATITELDGSVRVVPKLGLVPMVKASMCATRGALVEAFSHMKVSDPTFRAYAPASSGDAGSLSFVYQGPTEDVKRLASNQLRRQVGLKLRAQDGCNLVYVMWRIEPKPGLDISVKRNPGARSNEECGTSGYTKVKPRRTAAVPPLRAGEPHTLSAEIVDGDDLYVWIDNRPVWRGRLGAASKGFTGPAGIRSDNVKLDIASFAAPAAGPASKACPKGDVPSD
jgi:hypothetical protein